MKLKNIFKRIIPATYNKIDKSDKKIQKQIREFKKPLYDFIRYTEIMYEAKATHETIFPKYKNILRGKDVVIIGNGPTLDKWIPIDDCIQMGVNSSIFLEKLKLNYLFWQDYDLTYIQKLKELLKKRKDINCKLFVGMHYNPKVTPIPLYEIEALKAEPYFFYEGIICPDFFPWPFTIDISQKPFFFYYSTIFIALQFALYTHPKKIFIVGCDCNTVGHHSGYVHGGDPQDDPFTPQKCELLKDGWIRFKSFASRLYPDIEIISINPLGLKGLFHDVYTEEYLVEHPEINRNEVEIYR